jgi:hypothetical protein
MELFKPFKSAGADGIVAALLQQGVKHSMAYQCHIFRAYLARRYTPKAWRLPPSFAIYPYTREGQLYWG